MDKHISHLVLIFSLVLSIVGCEKKDATEQPIIRPVRAMKVSDVNQAMARSFPGRAKATQELDIAFEVAGKLIQRPVDIGTVVEAGQLLAMLDPRDFENKLASAKAERKRAQAHLSRIRVAVRSGAVAQQDLTDAQARFEAADANVNIRAKALEDSVLHAPFDGNVAMTYVENFQNVQAKQPVLRLLDQFPHRDGRQRSREYDFLCAVRRIGLCRLRSVSRARDPRND